MSLILDHPKTWFQTGPSRRAENGSPTLS
jgi:hypothetical protein